MMEAFVDLAVFFRFWRTRLVALFAFFFLSSHLNSAYIIPGSFPIDHQPGDSVEIKVNSLSSVKTQLKYPHYHLSYPKPDDLQEKAENIGEILMGDKVESSAYKVKMLEEQKCALLGNEAVKQTERSRALFVSMIDDEYTVNNICENLPASAKVMMGPNLDNVVYGTGYPVGWAKDPNVHWLYNHVTFTLKYHRHNNNDDQLRIVGFEVSPRSIQHYLVEENGQKRYECISDMVKVIEGAESVAFTYDIIWEESSIKWASRWDAYLKVNDTEIHWFSIINSLMIVFFLSGMIAMILLRTLLRDIARYNEMDNLEEAQEESGWKLIHGDAFRRPNYYKLLAVGAGTGVQILGMTVVTLIFAALGLLSPTNRGALLQAMLLLFTFMGFPAGFASSRFNKLFEGEDCTRSFHVTMMTALLFPGVCFCVFFILNLFIWGKSSCGAVPFGTMFLLLVLWFGISLPLVFMGSYFGYKKPQFSVPVRTNQIPRQIPPQHWLTHPFVTCLIGGVLPFGAVFTELLFIMSSIWQHQFYYLFGFLVLVLAILLITCAEISIAFTYFQLAGEDYRWWWRSYWCSAASSVYVFAYAILYFFSRLSITKPVSVLLYFGYMAIISYAFFLLTGAIGFIATFFFVRAIYGSIKIE